LLQAVPDLGQGFEAQSHWGRTKNVFPCVNHGIFLGMTADGYHTKVVTFLDEERDFCFWSNYAIFQGITTV